MGRKILRMTEGDAQRLVTDRIRARHRANPVNQLFGSAKSRARKFGLDFNLEKSDIVVPAICPALGIPLDFSTKDNVPSLDRVIPERGYVKGNVRVISWRANRIKLNAARWELEGIVRYIRENGGV